MTKTPLRLVFMGTPDFACPALQGLIDAGHDVICVYTQPPRPKGRGRQVQLSPVHALAERHGIPVMTPTSLRRDEQAQGHFAALRADVAVVAAYGLLLPPVILRAPRLGCVNIHASLLPRWRGASPIQHAILAGDKETGITVMRMEEGLDTGPMMMKRAVTLHPHTTARSLHDELAALGAAMIVDVLERPELWPLEAQNDALATYAPLLSKADGRIDWTQDAAALDRHIRALNPWPGVWTENDGKRLKILAAEDSGEAFTEPPGTVVDRMGHVACGQDSGLRLIRVQPENVKAMDLAAAINGGYLKPDDHLA